MQTALILIVVLAGFGALIGLQLKKKTTEGIDIGEYERLKSELDRKIDDITTLTSKLDKAQSEKDELSGKGKQLYDNYKNIEADLKILRQERDGLQRALQEFEANDKRKEKEFTDRLQKLDAAKEKLEEERARVIREDEERRAAELEARDRLWADHENAVIASLTDLCKQPQFSFTSFTNTNLPEGFDGSLKPDFMIDFLGQYVIFDAKVSKAKSLQTYINTQVKDTVTKVKDNDRIYKSIFLVVPASALSELKAHHYTIDGYQLFVVSPEALPPILAALKRITMYEFAEALDPQQRENIVQIVAELDFHINLRNAADLFLSNLGADLLEKAKKIDPTLAEEVALKKAPMNAKASIAASEIKKMVISLAHQKEQIDRMIAPKSAVTLRSIEEAKDMLSDTLFQ
jgi:hypothetical protein